ncbi:MAG: glycine/sarcosine/betaine reductase selenoprotein B family protein [Desulfobacterales bacterium]
MAFNLEKFKTAYEKWVTESLPEYRAGRMAEIVKRYPFVVSDDVPWTPYTGQPSEQTFALVTSGGLFLKNSQPAFDAVSIHGDPSLREIPKSVSQKDIGIAHAHYDHSLAEQDIDIIFPIHRLTELEAEGIIGRVTETNYSFSYVNDVVTLVAETIPKFISRIKADGVDVLLLVPV